MALTPKSIFFFASSIDGKVIQLIIGGSLLSFATGIDILASLFYVRQGLHPVGRARQPGPNFISILGNRGPGEIKSHIWYFCKAKFFSNDLFWSLGYPGVRGLGYQGQTCVKNLSWVGVEVCAKFGEDWSGS